MDSPLVEFEDVALPDGTVVSVGPEVVFLGKGSQVRWGNALARLGVCLDRDHLTWRAQHGDRFFVSTATSELVGDVAELADHENLTLLERPVGATGSGSRHTVAWDQITRVGILAAATGAPRCA
ncbi:MAG TPA: hypothetical protein VKE40_05690 [Gemmataceae bacterium]|nr:hypothetical protein [Gemmataceae bacterium]